MRNDEEFQLIENRLSAEARRVGTGLGGGPSASSLAAEFERRARRRRRTQVACGGAALALLLAGLTIALYRPVSPVQELGRNRSEPEPVGTANGGASKPEPTLVAIPVLIASHTEDGQPLVVTGWYIPEQAGIDLLDFPPADFDATGRLYGTEGEATDMGTI